MVCWGTVEDKRGCDVFKVREIREWCAIGGDDGEGRGERRV